MSRNTKTAASVILKITVSTVAYFFLLFLLKHWLWHTFVMINKIVVDFIIVVETMRPLIINRKQ